MMADLASDLAARAVEAAGTLHASAYVSIRRNASVRFGRNEITQNQDTEGTSVVLSVGDGQRRASVSFEDVSAESMKSAAGRARQLMEASPADPEYLAPPEGGQVYPVIHDAFDPEASECPAGKRVEAVRGVIAAAAGHGLEAGGICENNLVRTAIATSTGNLSSHQATSVGLSFTLEKGSASSYRQLESRSWPGIDWKRASEKVAGEALANRGQVEPDAGEYSLILEPLAVTNLLAFLYWSMDARRADEGLTVFSGMMGKKVSGKGLTLFSNPDGQVKGVPFNQDGLPSRSSVWIRDGLLENLPCDRFWALKTGMEPLFIPDCLEMKGGEGTVDDLIGGTGKGILIRRFWYIRFVDQRTLKLTGMTRDGVFLVENGRIARPLSDFRWNWRPLELLGRIEAMGDPVRAAFAFAPPVKVGGVRYPCF